MTLQAPQLLWLLLALPLLWWLSLPPRPRAVAWTPHLMQWRLALGALRRRPPRFARLRFLLLASAAVAAALAAAQPRWRGAPGPRRLVVVLDHSASMGAQDEHGSQAAARARAGLAAAFAALPAHVDVTLLAVGGDLRRRHGASARALHDLGAPAGALAADLPALAAAAAATPDTAVWTLTDGQGQSRLPEVGARTWLPASGPNAAVLAVRLDDQWPLPVLALEIDVVAFAPAPARVGVVVRGAAHGAPLPPSSLPPGEVRTLRWNGERLAAGGELVVAVELAGDVLPADDAAVLRLPPLPAPRIAVLADAEAGPFAEAAATALAGEVGGEVVAAAAGRDVGLLLVDGGRVDLEPGRVRALTFGSELGAAGASGAPTPWPTPQVVDWDRSARLGAGLDLSELRVQRAWRGLLPSGEPFLWADDGGERVPLAVVAGDAQRASVHFAFRLQDANLPLLAAFPQLLRRAFVRCYGAGAAAAAVTAPPATGEQDLRAPARGPDRPLPPFGGADHDLLPWCLLAGLAALAVRAFVR